MQHIQNDSMNKYIGIWLAKRKKKGGAKKKLTSQRCLRRQGGEIGGFEGGKKDGKEEGKNKTHLAARTLDSGEFNWVSRNCTLIEYLE